MNNFKMKKEALEKWITALRNTPEDKHVIGTYQKNGDNFCAIGVYLDKCVPGRWLEPSEPVYQAIENRISADEPVYQDTEGTLYYAGGSFVTGLTPELEEEVVMINDIHVWTFNQIAYWLELNVESE